MWERNLKYLLNGFVVVMKILKISQSELPATLMKSLILLAYFAESCDCEAILLTMMVVCVCVCPTCRTVQWSVRVFSAHHLSAPLIQLQSTCPEHAVKSASVSIHTNKHKMRPCIYRDAYISQVFLSPFVSSLLLFLSIISIFSSLSIFPPKSLFL